MNFDLHRVFPKASQSFVAANPHLRDSATVSPKPKQNAVQVNSVPNGGRVGHSSGFDMVPFGRKGMNKTEAEYALILEAMKRKGEIKRYEFEPVTLRFAGVRYTPDFLVIDLVNSYSGEVEFFKFIEVKGPFIKGNRERAVERFRHAKTYWPEFTFEMMQRGKDGSWKQII